MVRLLAVITLDLPVGRASSSRRSCTPGSPVGGATSSRSWRRSEAQPVRWNPCEPIHYVVNLGAAPLGSLQDVQDAVLRHLECDRDRVHVRRADATRSRRGTATCTSPIGTAIDGRRCSSGGSIRGRAPSTSIPGGREAAGVAGPLYPQPGPVHDLRERRRRDQRRRSEPAGVRFPGVAGSGRAARAGPRDGPRATIKAQRRAHGAIGWRRDRLRSGDLEGLRELGRSAPVASPRPRPPP